jgi:tetratricopeptide (TPR) repeat protein
MVLQVTGIEVLPETLAPLVYIPERRGSLQVEMIAAARGYDRVPYILQPSLDALLVELRAGHPVLVMQNLGWDVYPLWHYAVVIGYRPARDEIVLRSGVTERLVMDARAFMDDWSKAGRWGVAVLEPDELPAADDPRGYLRAVAGMEEAGRYAAAARAYAAAVQRWPDEPAAWLGLGNARYALGDAAGAESAYREALERRENLTVARNNLAQLLAERGCTAAARREIERALVDAPPGLVETVRATRDEITAMPAGDCSSR